MALCEYNRHLHCLELLLSYLASCLPVMPGLATHCLSLGLPAQDELNFHAQIPLPSIALQWVPLLSLFSITLPSLTLITAELARERKVEQNIERDILLD